jgi:hypothetical protein
MPSQIVSLRAQAETQAAAILGMEQARVMGEEVVELKAEIRIKDAALQASAVALQAKDALLQSKDAVIDALRSKDAVIEGKTALLQAKDAIIAAKDAEIQRLQAELARCGARPAPAPAYALPRDYVLPKLSIAQCWRAWWSDTTASPMPLRFVGGKLNSASEKVRYSRYKRVMKMLQSAMPADVCETNTTAAFKRGWTSLEMYLRLNHSINIDADAAPSTLCETVCRLGETFQPPVFSTIVASHTGPPRSLDEVLQEHLQVLGAAEAGAAVCASARAAAAAAAAARAPVSAPAPSRAPAAKAVAAAAPAPTALFHFSPRAEHKFSMVDLSPV